MNAPGQLTTHGGFCWSPVGTLLLSQVQDLPLYVGRSLLFLPAVVLCGWKRSAWLGNLLKTLAGQ